MNFFSDFVRQEKRQASTRRIDLDVVRGIAILLAVGWHFNAPTGDAGLDIVLAPARIFGWAGVDVFFVLSGFLVGRMIYKEERSTGKFDYKTFLVRRILRLWPVLYLYLIFKLMTGENFYSFFWQNASHLQNYFIPSSSLHLWSLAVEEQFYLVLSLLVLVSVVSNLSRKKVVCLLAATLVVCPLLRIAALAAGVKPVFVQFQLQYRFDTLASGVLLAIMSIDNAPNFKTLYNRKIVLAVSCICGCMFLMKYSLFSPVGQTAGYSIAYLFGASLLLLIYNSGIETWAPIPAAIMAFFGRISYPWYVWQAVTVKILERVQDHLPASHRRALIVVLSYLSSAGLAWLLSIILERPLMLLRDKLFPAREPAVNPSKVAAFV